MVDQPPVLEASQTKPRGQAPPQGKKFLENRSAIFVMLFCVTGFLGIPVLCKSPVFTSNEKWFWSIVVTIYTCILIFGTVAILRWSYAMVSEILSY